MRLSRLLSIGLLVAALGSSAPIAAAVASSRPAASTRRAQVAVRAERTPFARTSPWNTRLPDHAPLDPHSRAIVSQINDEVHWAYGHAALNTYAYSAPVYTVPRNERTVDMHWSNCLHESWEAPAFAASLRHVPVPAHAVPAQGTDAEMVIYQPSTNSDWEFWEMSDHHGRWSACWGGRIDNVSHNPGVFANGTGATASGLPLLGGLIELDNLRFGSIDHAIAVSVPEARRYDFSWPAQRTDGYDPSPVSPAEGERFRFPASLDLSQFDLSPGELMIARAIQHYGMIITDQSGAMSFQAQDPLPDEVGGAADPYARYFSGPGYSWLDAMPWKDLQALAWNYGEPSH